MQLTKPGWEKGAILPGLPILNMARLSAFSESFKQTTKAWCLIEDLSHPGFQIQIQTHWLSSTRPSEAQPQTKQSPIILPLSALDKLVQMILSKNQLWRVDKNDTASAQSASSPVASAATQKQTPTRPLSLLHGPQADRRDES